RRPGRPADRQTARRPRLLRRRHPLLRAAEEADAPMTDPLAADRLARLPGPTPFLVLDLARAATAYLTLPAELPGVGVRYAMKSTPHVRILQRLHRLGC